jgi:hypothetical protein
MKHINLAHLFGGKKEAPLCVNGPNCAYLKKGCCRFRHPNKVKGQQPMTKEKYVKTTISQLESLIETLYLKVGVLELFVNELNKNESIRTILMGNVKWDYLMSQNFNLDQIRRDLIRTEEGKKTGFCPLG